MKEKMKKILVVCLTLIMLLSLSVNGYAAEVNIYGKAVDKQVQASLEAHQRSKEIKNQQIKEHDKVRVIAENGGNLAYTYSEDVDTQEEIELFIREMRGIQAQGTTSLYDSNTVVEPDGEGDFEQYFDDSVYYENNIGDDIIELNGEGASFYYKYPSAPLDANINYITSVTDSFLIEYDEIDSITTELSVSGGTTGGESSGSGSWTRSYTYSEYEIEWPDISGKSYYGRSYGTVFAKTENITEVTHNSSAIAVLKNGNSVWCNAYDYALI